MSEPQKSSRGVVLFVVAVLVLGGAATLAVRYLKGPPLRKLPTQAYFYDTAADKAVALFVASIDEQPPILGPSQKAGADGRGTAVRAYVFSCGACTEQDRFVGYLESMSITATPAKGPPNRGGAVGVIASPDTPTRWVSRSSPE